ncbi:TPA: archaeosortase D [Methanocaldococcus jannaschii]|uniref:Probable archaeosortase D n=2 Tax=Methanocaldococcus jannaschii TaxID=2190 RepID=ARTD_METJA|nr:archaeosortase D [Methanocaldococcus jannaschii]P81329.1 RecName: Full=Probable archaeosortase D [Methanocaldococcus jannaschii DSM 2661]AAB99490.1 hypothetical protein MJ_1469.1 [Methanocaldococcus jannaschii DSM 2661]HII60155.1 archaeosortase D [Methanocaldococcus jannaschii]
MGNKNAIYILRFLIYFFIFYYILKMLEGNIMDLLTITLSKLLNLKFYKNEIIVGKNIIEISSPCTCSLEMALFLGYIFGTPDVPIKYKISYSVFGLSIITISNILRIILIINYSNMINYNVVHDVISFIIFPIALFLNWFWIYLLKMKKIIMFK